jgi:hypothetical protein
MATSFDDPVRPKPDWDLVVTKSFVDMGVQIQPPEGMDLLRRLFVAELEIAYQTGRNHGFRECASAMGIGHFNLTTPSKQ